MEVTYNQPQTITVTIVGIVINPCDKTAKVIISRSDKEKNQIVTVDLPTILTEATQEHKNVLRGFYKRLSADALSLDPSDITGEFDDFPA